MIYIGNEKDLNKDLYDENWMIVRKPGSLPAFVRIEPLLSPSLDLFAKYRAAFHAGKFDHDFFQNIYVPQFLQELSQNEEALELLRDLCQWSISKDIFLGCYCDDESLCHRSIIAGVLLGMGAEIKTEEAYLKYYVFFQQGHQGRGSVSLSVSQLSVKLMEHNCDTKNDGKPRSQCLAPVS